ACPASLGPGTSAPYPVARTASTTSPTLACRGSNVTVALPNSRFTVASSTPGHASRARCTRLEHAAHVIPDTGIVIVSPAGRVAVATSAPRERAEVPGDPGEG